MRRAVLIVAGACLLAAPTVLAFYSGGYFAQPRLIAGIVVWALVLCVAAVGPAPLPSTTPGRLALAGLVALTAWSALSILWAPQAGPAVQNVQRLVLYVGALLLAVGTLREAGLRRAVEPALAAGAAIVIGYGLAGRLLPDLVKLASSRSALGRLEQPLTYWNAEGALAALGLVLCARLAGDRRPAAGHAPDRRRAGPRPGGGPLSLVLARRARGRGPRSARARRARPLARAAARRRHRAGQRRLRRRGHRAAAPLRRGDHAARRPDRGRRGERRSWSRARAPSRPRPRAGTRGCGPVAWAATAVVAAGLVVGGIAERPSERELSAGAGAGRLTSVSSNRYEYWRVALDAFRDDPLIGTGSGGFRVVWLQERPIRETVRDTHSLEFEVAAELGLVGLLALALMCGGVAVTARRALAGHGPLAAGAAAALVVWFLHASIDWDWEMPAVTLPALVLAGLLITQAEGEPATAADAPR